jgi:glycogenin glucosyltransferase
MGRPDLIGTFTKINLWKLEQFKTVVYVDADMVCLQPPDELFNLDVNFAAAPDIGWPDIFNSGLMVLKPNLADYYALLALAQRGISFDGADQGLLNMHFRNYHRISFRYNVTPSGNYQYLPAFRHFQSTISMVHFIGNDKPWKLGRQASSISGAYGELLGDWWAVYDRHYRVPDFVAGQSAADAQRIQDSRHVRKFVTGENIPPIRLQDLGPAPTAEHHSVPEAPPLEHPEMTVELPLTHVEHSGEEQKPSPPHALSEPPPPPAPAHDEFTAPMADWDASRFAPPPDSKPEAANFPTQTYGNEWDSDHPSKELFVAPEKYPEPPKDMWFEVPPKPVEEPKPRQIFPWESTAPKATRVFPKSPFAPAPVKTATPPVTTPQSTSVPTSEPSPDPWEHYTRTNAWDDVPEIGRYVQGFSKKVRGPQHLEFTTADGRRDSLRLTDFPTAVERPSLPVTPAPRRRDTLWGSDDNEEEFPEAEGVPDAASWVST